MTAVSGVCSTQDGTSRRCDKEKIWTTPRAHGSVGLKTELPEEISRLAKDREDNDTETGRCYSQTTSHIQNIFEWRRVHGDATEPRRRV